MKRVAGDLKRRDHFSAAVKDFIQGHLDLAETHLKAAMAESDGVHLQLLKGRIAYARGKQDEAEAVWQDIVEQEQEHTEAWNNLGVLFKSQERVEEAREAFSNAMELAPERAEIPYNLGNLHKNLGNAEEAVRLYSKAIELNPNYAPAYNNLGTLYESRDEHEKALDTFKKGLNADSGDASLHLNMALAYQNENRLEEARSSYGTALKSRPGWLPGLLGLGRTLQDMGEEVDAARTFRSLLKADPENVSALNNLGLVYENLSRSGEARDCFQKALSINPEFRDAALHLHDSYRRTNNMDKALEELNKQVKFHPRDPEINIRMAGTLRELGRLDDASRVLDHVLKQMPDNPEALRARAELELDAGRPDQAEALLRRLPKDPSTVRRLARLYIAEDRGSEAGHLLEDLVRTDSEDAESRRMLSALYSESDINRAVDLRAEAVALSPNNAEDLVALAALHSRNGRPNEALARLDGAVTLLGERGTPEDLDAMNDVLNLYEQAAAMFEQNRSHFFGARTEQLSLKLQALEEEREAREEAAAERPPIFPVEEEDALSLLDIGAMDPVIRINEEEETVYLEDVPEDFTDTFTEISDFEDACPPPAAAPPAPVTDTAEPDVPVSAVSAVSAPADSRQFENSDSALDSYSPVPEPPVAPPPRADSAQGQNGPRQRASGRVAGGPAVPDHQSQNQPAAVPPINIHFNGSSAGSADSAGSQQTAPAVSIHTEFPAPPPEQDQPVEPTDSASPNVTEESGKPDSPVSTIPEPPEFSEDPPEQDEDENNTLPNKEKMAELFRYLSRLADETTGEGRKNLIDRDVPLKLAGLGAKLSGEQTFREAAQKFDRRSQKRDLQLDKEKIRGGLNAFRSLVDSYPGEAVGESLARKLNHIMSSVKKKNLNPERREPDGSSTAR